MQSHNTSVLRWIEQRFGQEVSPFVDSLTPPHLSGIHHVDEMVVNVRKEKNNFQWLWNLMDNTTRFGLVVRFKRVKSYDAEMVQDSKSKTPKPKAVIHDGL